MLKKISVILLTLVLFLNTLFLKNDVVKAEAPVYKVYVSAFKNYAIDTDQVPLLYKKDMSYLDNSKAIFFSVDGDNTSSVDFLTKYNNWSELEATAYLQSDPLSVPLEFFTNPSGFYFYTQENPNNLEIRINNKKAFLYAYSLNDPNSEDVSAVFKFRTTYMNSGDKVLLVKNWVDNNNEYNLRDTEISVDLSTYRYPVLYRYTNHISTSGEPAAVVKSPNTNFSIRFDIQDTTGMDLERRFPAIYPDNVYPNYTTQEERQYFSIMNQVYGNIKMQLFNLGLLDAFSLEQFEWLRQYYPNYEYHYNFRLDTKPIIIYNNSDLAIKKSLENINKALNNKYTLIPVTVKYSYDPYTSEPISAYNENLQLFFDTQATNLQNINNNADLPNILFEFSYFNNVDPLKRIVGYANDGYYQNVESRPVPLRFVVQTLSEKMQALEGKRYQYTDACDLRKYFQGNTQYSDLDEDIYAATGISGPDISATINELCSEDTLFQSAGLNGIIGYSHITNKNLDGLTALPSSEYFDVNNGLQGINELFTAEDTVKLTQADTSIKDNNTWQKKVDVSIFDNLDVNEVSANPFYVQRIESEVHPDIDISHMFFATDSNESFNEKQFVKFGNHSDYAQAAIDPNSNYLADYTSSYFQNSQWNIKDGYIRINNIRFYSPTLDKPLDLKNEIACVLNSSGMARCDSDKFFAELSDFIYKTMDEKLDSFRDNISVSYLNPSTKKVSYSLRTTRSNIEFDFELITKDHGNVKINGYKLYAPAIGDGWNEVPSFSYKNTVTYDMVGEDWVLKDSGDPVFNFIFSKQTTNTAGIKHDYLKFEKPHKVTITNTLDTSQLSLANLNILNIWEDQDNQFGLRPESIEVKLLENSDKLATLNDDNWNKELSKNSWDSQTSFGYEKSKDFDINNFDIELKAIPRYTSEITRNEPEDAYDFTIINRLVPEEAMGTTTKFKKHLVVNNDAEIPNAEIKFAISAGQAIDATEDTLAVYSGKDPDKVKINEEYQIGSVFFTAGESTTPGPVEGVATTEEKFATKDVLLDFSEVEFDDVGIYSYVLVEQPHSWQALGIDKEPTRVIHVHVLMNETTGKLEVGGYVGYEGNINSAPKSFPVFTYEYLDLDSDGVVSEDEKEQQLFAKNKAEKDFYQNLQDGSGKPDGSYVNADEPIGVEAGEKSDKYTNRLSTQNLEFAKETLGNFGSRDQYFEFTVSLSNLEKGTIITVSPSSTFDRSTSENNATVHPKEWMDEANNTDHSPDIYYTEEELDDYIEIHQESPEWNVGDIKKAGMPGQQLIADDSGEIVQRFYLHSGQSVKLTGLPKGASYMIVETDDKLGYVTLGDMNGFADITDEDVEINVQNSRNGVIPTGISIKILIPFAILTLAFLLFLLKRKDRDEDLI